jgi:outer membrane protein assembly factor BamB
MRRLLHPAGPLGAALSAVLLVLPASRVSGGSDWPQFRGPGGSGVSEERELPIAWSDTENVAWRVELPGRGVSSPIVVSGRVYVTANSGYRKDRLHVLCFDAESGARLWERQFWSTGRTMCHPKTCMAAPTPASDGKRVFAFYSTNDLFCLDLDGNLLWLRGLTADYPNATNGTGMASSPIVAGKLLVVQVENQSDSLAAGLDLTTGENVWKIRRLPKPSWSTPALLGGRDGSDTLILESWEQLSGHDPRTGRQLWVYSEGCNCIPSCALFEGLVLVPSGGLTALRPPASGEEPEVAWKSSRLRPATASPLVYRRDVYVLNSAGILTCANAASGERRWQLRLKGPFGSSPVAAGDHIYCINEAGLAQVVKIGEKGEMGEMVAKSDFGETILATPAIAGGGIFIRSDRHLWKIAKRSGT